MYHMKSSPALAPLVARVERLESSGIVVALGGSGLLAALGLADIVRDWDLTTDAALETVREALAGERTAHHGSDELHADQKLVLDDEAIEIIIGFAFHVEGGVVRIPTVVTGRWQGIPLGSPEGWAVAYELLGRPRKSETLLAHLAAVGADAQSIARLLREPLPGAIAARLADLPTSSDA